MQGRSVRRPSDLSRRIPCSRADALQMYAIPVIAFYPYREILLSRVHSVRLHHGSRSISLVSSAWPNSNSNHVEQVTAIQDGREQLDRVRPPWPHNGTPLALSRRRANASDPKLAIGACEHLTNALVITSTSREGSYQEQREEILVSA